MLEQIVLADIETLMRYMREYDMAEIHIGNVKIISRPKPIEMPDFKTDREVTADDILQNPYAGLKI